ncbi:MAG: hypothetical protein CL908_06770 [Deltaproteobacteria bacterium]|nr:hypothetical protein [Deltaproteobacteria bacterium]
MLRRNPNDKNRSARLSGFTVVELVVLIAVVGILASVAAPRFLSMNEFASPQASRQALSDLRFAQRLASGSGCPVQVDFEADGYTLTQRTGCRTGAFTLPLVDPVTNVAPFSITLPSGVVATSDVDPLVFDALGRATTTAGEVVDATLSVGGLPLETIGETGLVRVP